MKYKCEIWGFFDSYLSRRATFANAGRRVGRFDKHFFAKYRSCFVIMLVIFRQSVIFCSFFKKKFVDLDQFSVFGFLNYAAFKFRPDFVFGCDVILVDFCGCNYIFVLSYLVFNRLEGTIFIIYF